MAVKDRRSSAAARRYKEFKEQNSRWHQKIQESVKKIDRAARKNGAA